MQSDMLPAGIRKLKSISSYADIAMWASTGTNIALTEGTSIHILNYETGEKTINETNHSNKISALAWASSGDVLATASYDATIRFWNVKNWRLIKRTMQSHLHIDCIAWHPESSYIASGDGDGNIQIWKFNQITQDISLIHEVAWYPWHPGSSNFDLQWSSDGQKLAIAGADNQVFLFEGGPTNVTQLAVHNCDKINLVGKSTKITWHPTENILAIGSADGTIWLYDTALKTQIGILEGHTSEITSLSFSDKGQILTSSSSGATRLWRNNSWQLITVIPTISKQAIFHPQKPLLLSSNSIYKVDINYLIGISTSEEEVQYSNAKVVLVGDSGVGKSGLALVLAGETYRPTESTHGRRIWTLDHKYKKLPNGREEIQEIILWDMAGQPGYRMVHQLHLNEVVVALIVFDQRSEINPLAGIKYWHRALLQAQRVQKSTNNSDLSMFLVAARIDRAGIGVSKKRLQEIVKELNFKGFAATSAREGTNIDRVREWVKKSIDWSRLPRVTSTKLFQSIKLFLILEKKTGRLLSGIDDLYFGFLRHEKLNQSDSLYNQFLTVLGRMESRALVRRLSFGDQVLLQPEILDAYASAIVTTAKDEPDGLGYILEDAALEGRFYMSEDERIDNKSHERILILSTIEDFILHDIAIREQTQDGVFLIFPSELTRDYPELQAPENRAITYTFEGAILNIYATLAVRLSHNGFFKKHELWRNASLYKSVANDGGLCGMYLHRRDEGKASLIIFYQSELTIGMKLDEYLLDQMGLLYAKNESDQNFVEFDFSNFLLENDDGKILLYESEIKDERTTAYQNAPNPKVWELEVVYGSSDWYSIVASIRNKKRQFHLRRKVEPSLQTRQQFEQFILAHLEQRALPNSVVSEIVFRCHSCNEDLTEPAQKRLKLGKNTITCSYCDEITSLQNLGTKTNNVESNIISHMNRQADQYRDAQTLQTMLSYKSLTNSFDVFLCHNRADRTIEGNGHDPIVSISDRLKARGILPWLDIEQIQPGKPWQRELEAQIKNIKSVAVIVSDNGIGPWQNMEVEAFLREFVGRNCPVIPVILSNTSSKPTLPIFLKGMNWVDFRQSNPDPFEQLVWGITGKRGGDRLDLSRG